MKYFIQQMNLKLNMHQIDFETQDATKLYNCWLKLNQTQTKKKLLNGTIILIFSFLYNTSNMICCKFYIVVKYLWLCTMSWYGYNEEIIKICVKVKDTWAGETYKITEYCTPDILSYMEFNTLYVKIFFYFGAFYATKYILNWLILNQL